MNQVMRSQLFRASIFLKHSFSNRSYNSTSSVCQQSTDFFDISNEAVEKVKQRSKTSKQDEETKIKQNHAGRKNLISTFKHYFDCSEDQAKALTENKKLIVMTLPKVKEKIEILFKNKVTVKSILDNPWLLEIPTKQVDQKLPLVLKFEPRDINDMIHMIRLSPYQLKKYGKICDSEREIVPGGNRVYYFAQRLNVEPALVSKYFSTHLFMFDLDFKMLKENLDIMIEYRVEPVAVLRDLWAFKYLPISIRTRFDRCLSAQKVNLKPWMVRCTEEILDRSLTLSKESSSVLGENTVLDYLTERLGYDRETMNSIVSKHEIVLASRVTRIKEILDYLLLEEKFEPYQVANVIRIISHSLETTKKRIKELKSHGCRPSSLIIVCKSQTEYRKFLDAWIVKKKKLES